MMTYDVAVISIGEWMWRGTAIIDGAEVGFVRIACETQEEAEAYMEQTFLPDLRKNYPRQFGDLVFPWEIVPEAEPEAGEV